MIWEREPTVAAALSKHDVEAEQCRLFVKKNSSSKSFLIMTLFLVFSVLSYLLPAVAEQ
jgi:hypothetical protein